MERRLESGASASHALALSLAHARWAACINSLIKSVVGRSELCDVPAVPFNVAIQQQYMIRTASANTVRCLRLYAGVHIALNVCIV